MMKLDYFVLYYLKIVLLDIGMRIEMIILLKKKNFIFKVKFFNV